MTKKSITLLDLNGIQYPNCPRCGNKWKKSKYSDNIFCSSVHISKDAMNEVIYLKASCLQGICQNSDNKNILILMFKIDDVAHSLEWHDDHCRVSWIREDGEWEHSEFDQGIELPFLTFDFTIERLKNLLVFQ